MPCPAMVAVEILCSYMKWATSSILYDLVTCCILPGKAIGVVGVAEVSWIQDVDISLMYDLRWSCMYFIEWVGEEVKPVLSLIEYFRYEDQVGTIFRCRFDMDTSQFDVVGVYQLRFYIDKVGYFREGE